MGVCQPGTEIGILNPIPPFECGDISRVSRVTVIGPLSVSKPRSLNQPMGLNIVFGIVDPGCCWVSLKDLESGEHDRTRRRSDGGENAVASVCDVDWRTGDRFVVLEVVQGYDPTASLGS